MTKTPFSSVRVCLSKTRTEAPWTNLPRLAMEPLRVAVIPVFTTWVLTFFAGIQRMADRESPKLASTRKTRSSIFSTPIAPSSFKVSASTMVIPSSCIVQNRAMPRDKGSPLGFVKVIATTSVSPASLPVPLATFALSEQPTKAANAAAKTGKIFLMQFITWPP